jgi:hypothetical protein
MTTQIAKVYKLTNSVDDKWYLGSTKNRLAKRIGDHRRQVRDGKTSVVYNHMRETGVENWVITLIESKSVANKEEQLRFERAKLDELKDENCLNCNRPHATAEEKVERNRTTTAAWRQANPEQHRALHRATRARVVAENRFHCDVCNYSAATPYKLRRHNTSRRHQRAVEQAEEESESEE